MGGAMDEAMGGAKDDVMDDVMDDVKPQREGRRKGSTQRMRRGGEPDGFSCSSSYFAVYCEIIAQCVCFSYDTC